MKTRRARAHRRTSLCVLLALVLLTSSACGARWSDEQHAAAVANFEGRGGATSAKAQSATPGATSSQSSGAPTGGAAPGAAPGGGTAGGSDAGGGGGDGAQAPTLPCAAPSSEIGVTNDTITLGAMSTQQGPVPGLGATMAAGARAYVEYQNSIGGICGRKIELKTGDDAFDNGQNRAVVSDLSQQVLGFAGSFGLADAGGADVIAAGNIPYTGTTGSAAMRSTPSVFETRPQTFANPNAVPKYQYLYAQGVRKAALVYTAADAARIQIQQIERPQMEAAGIQVVNVQEVPLSTLSFDSAARGVANSGADYMLFLSDVSYSASMARSMRNTGYQLKFEEYITAYGSNFADLAGSAAEGVVNWIPSLPDEDPETVPEQALYHQWFQYVAPDLKPDIFSAAAWASMEAFMQALTSLPGPISRAAVVSSLGAIGKWDANGLLGPIMFGAKQNLGCTIAMKFVGGRWTRLTPDAGFLC